MGEIQGSHLQKAGHFSFWEKLLHPTWNKKMPLTTRYFPTKKIFSLLFKKKDRQKLYHIKVLRENDPHVKTNQKAHETTLRPQRQELVNYIVYFWAPEYKHSLFF